ncbi:hypothetical protein EVAR_100324_1 [Eumeta japonica]|uniref:Uncharacterized protein n=1 Tax=Eumeta variegata TaxID=151549 RepID=A0A4C1ZQL5_EUMVA|nr:hypothetical protein EVAR_100324_1 [Eumeta japonica]
MSAQSGAGFGYLSKNRTVVDEKAIILMMCKRGPTLFIELLMGKHARMPPESRSSPPPMDRRNARGVTSALPVF